MINNSGEIHTQKSRSDSIQHAGLNVTFAFEFLEGESAPFWTTEYATLPQ